MSEKKATKIDSFFASRTGKILLNRVYSWGAAVVITGALFKILHWPYGNIILMIGMGVEALVFVVSGFDNPVLRDDEDDVESVIPNLAEVGTRRSHNSVQSHNNSEIVSEATRNIDNLTNNISSVDANTVKGINNDLERMKAMYEDTIANSETVSEETAKMAKHIEALNKVYARMLQAVTSPTNGENSSSNSKNSL